MSQPTTSMMPSSGSPEQGSGSSVKEHAEEAKEAGLQIAASAKDEGMAVVQESRRQAADLMREATGQLQEQAGAQKSKAVEGLRALGDQLQSMASGTDAGPAADLAHQASGKVTQFADWLDQNDPGSVVEGVRDFARRKPGAFLLGALAAGVVAGRVTRGVQGAVSSGGDGQSTAASASPSMSPSMPPSTPPSMPPMSEAVASTPPMGADAMYSGAGTASAPGTEPTVVGAAESGLPR